MITQVIALLCHVSSQPYCREEIVTEADIGIGIGCLIAEGQTVTDWKAHSIYAGPSWQISNVKCAPGGGYKIREAT